MKSRNQKDAVMLKGQQEDFFLSSLISKLGHTRLHRPKLGLIHQHIRMATQPLKGVFCYCSLVRKAKISTWSQTWWHMTLIWTLRGKWVQGHPGLYSEVQPTRATQWDPSQQLNNKEEEAMVGDNCSWGTDAQKFWGREEKGGFF